MPVNNDMSKDGGGAGIVLSHLSKSYGKVHAVRSVDLAIDAGQTVALLGPNGAGKTTTIDMVLGLARPDAGTVSVFGMSPATAVRNGLVGGMLQTGSLVQNLSVRELVTMVASLYPRPLDVEDVLRLTGTAEFADRQTMKLSGGQTQRVRFAIALVAGSDLLVLDEPTAALDVESRREFWTRHARRCRQREDGYLRYPLPGGSGRLRGPDHPHGPRPGRRRWPRHRDQSAAGSSTLRATLPGADLVVSVGAARGDQRRRPGRGGRTLVPDSDAALREMLRLFPAARDIEVRGAGLEEAFLELTADGDEDDEDDEEVEVAR